MPRKLVALILSLSLCLVGYADSLPIDLEDEIEPIEEFPIEIDTLDEFIQSYYTLLDNDEYLRSFPFIQQKLNVLSGVEEPLRGFLNKLMELRSGLRSQVTIYQIGDSHVKSGFFSTTARSSLVKYFETTEGSPTLNYQFSGINGASFYNLLNTSAIFDRAKELKPDLLVISLGTNDAQGTYNDNRFRTELRAFMKKMTDYQGSAAILFTLPPDGDKKGKHNSDIEKVSEEIVAFAREQRHSWWDLGEVMGGRNSISKWLSQGFASRDKIHFSPQGYMLQGYLFYDALMRAYKSHAEEGR